MHTTQMPSPELVNTLLRNRRSCFPAQYSGAKIPQETIQDILENANWAPNHKHTEPWRFIVFEGQGIERLAQFQAALYKSTTPEDRFEEKKYQKLQHNPQKASHIIAIVMRRDPQTTIPEIEEIAAVACAVQNMHLSAASFGLGAYWSTGGITYKDEAREFLGLEETDTLLGFFYLGVIEKPPKQSRRNPIQGKVRWVDA